MVRGLLRPVLVASLLMVSSAWAQPSRPISDTFNGANGSRPVGWTMPTDPGAGFWTLSDNRVISGDHSKTGKAEPLGLLTSLAGSEQFTDYYGNLDFTFLGESGGVVQFLRYQDAANHYEVGVFSEGGNRYAKIDKISLGVRKTLARVENSPSTQVPTFSAGAGGEFKPQVIRGIVFGNEIGLQLGSGTALLRVAAYDPDPIPAGKFGFGVVGGSAIFDNAILDMTPSKVFVKGSSGQVPEPQAAQPAEATPQPAASTGGSFVVQVGSNMSRDRADALVRSLTADSYTDARMVTASGGFTVTVGTGLSRERADQLFQLLRGQDYSPEAVVMADSPSATVSATPAVATAAPPVSGGARQYRVQVFEDFADIGQANAARETLIKDDYATVEVTEVGGRYRVLLGNFTSRTDADQMVANLLKDSYARAQVVETESAAPPADASASANDLSDLETMPEFANLSPEQRRRIRDLTARARAAESGTGSANELLAIRNETKALKDDLRLIMQGIARSDEERRDKEGRIRDLYREIDIALGQGNIQEAERQLAAAKAVYPDFSGHSYKEQRIRDLKGTGGQPSITPVPQATPLSEPDQARVSGLLTEARQAKAAQRNADALEKFQQVLRIEPANREALEEVRSLPGIVGSDRLVNQGSSPGLQTYLLYGGITAVVVMFGVIGIVLFQNIRRERELIKQVSQMQEFVANQSSGRFPVIGSNPAFPVVTGSTPGLTPEQFAALQHGVGGVPGSGLSPSPVFGGQQFGESGLGGGIPVQSSLAPALGQPQAPLPASPDFVGTESSTTVPLPFPGPPPTRGPLTDEVRLSPIAGQPVRPEPETAPVAAPVAEQIDLPPPPMATDVFAIPGFSPTAPLPPPPTPVPSTDKASSSGILSANPMPTPFPEPPSSAGGEAGFNDLQTVFIGPGENQHESAGNLFPPVPQVTEFPPPPLPPQPTPNGFDSAIRGVTPAPPLASNQDSSSLLALGDPSRGVIFQQNFDDETPEDQPLGWQGDYDYASLTVDRSIASQDVGHSVKFEKRTGAGSANYVCKFPKASGLVRVEFDIRCDDKNKYLLGFYIEKDEDFKQSIHTIVHRMDSKSTPSLRVQGEPVPYDFGTWRHMTYELNLPAGLVTAYVDGEQVIKDARLPTAPPYVNTLSIRDNLATTGVLYLDNISVTKM